MARYTWPPSERPDLTVEEMKEIARTVIDKTLADPDMAAKLRSVNSVVRFTYKDDEMWGPGVTVDLTLDLTKDPISYSLEPSDLKADISLVTETTHAHLFFMQKLNIMTAVTRGLIKVKGPLPKLVRLLPSLKPLYANYRAGLKELGREDILTFPSEGWVKPDREKQE